MEEKPDNNLKSPTIVSLKKAFNKRPALVYSGLVIIIIVVVILVRHNSKTVFTIDGTAYNQSYVNPIAVFPTVFLHGSNNTAYRSILNMIEYKTVANNLHITTTASQLNTQQQVLNGEYGAFTKIPSYKTWSNLVAQYKAIQYKLSTQYQNNAYQGYSFIFWFGNTIDGGPTYTPPNADNTTIYNQAKTYALGRANYYYGQLKTNKMTLAKAYGAVVSDPKLLVNSISNPSVNFGTYIYLPWTTQVYYQDVINYIQAQKTTGLSSVKTGTIYAGSPNYQKKDAYYYFVNINKINVSPIDFNQALKSLKVSYRGAN